MAVWSTVLPLYVSHHCLVGIRTISPRTISPRTISPGQYPPGQYPPRTISPRTISPRTISPRMIFLVKHVLVKNDNNNSSVLNFPKTCVGEKYIYFFF